MDGALTDYIKKTTEQLQGTCLSEHITNHSGNSNSTLMIGISGNLVLHETKDLFERLRP